MSLLEKLHTVLILAAVVIGLLLGQIPVLANLAEYFIVPFLFLLLLGLFLAIPLRDLKAGFFNAKFAATSLLINFIWTPFFAWALGALFLADYPPLWVGFIMLMVTPCTDWYLVFTAIAKGNVPLSTAILPVNLIMQVLLLPVYLFLFAGVMETIEFSVLIESIFLVILLPFLLAHTTRLLFKKIDRLALLEEKIIPRLNTGQILFLSLAIVAMFASQGKYLIENLNLVGILLLPVLLFFVSNFFLGRLVSRLLKFSYADSASLNLTTLARNSPVALAIAVTAFPDQPVIALALVIGPLIELPVLALLAQVLLYLGSRPVDLEVENEI